MKWPIKIFHILYIWISTARGINKDQQHWPPKTLVALKCGQIILQWKTTICFVHSIPILLIVIKFSLLDNASNYQVISLEFSFTSIWQTFLNFHLRQDPSHLAEVLKQAKIQKSLPKGSKRKFEIYITYLTKTRYFSWVHYPKEKKNLT